MRKLIVILVVLAALGAGYKVYWDKEAANFKARAMQVADNVNAQMKPFTKDLDFVHFDSVSVTGFPFAMVVELNKPTFNIPVSQLLGKLQKTSPSTTKTSNATPPFEWIEEMSFGDKVTFTTNIRVDSFTFAASGDRTNKTLVNRTLRHTLIGTSASPLTCHFNYERAKDAMPWTMPQFADGVAFLKAFRDFDCNEQGMEGKDGAGTPMGSADGFTFSLTHQPGDGVNHGVGIAIDIRNAKTTPAFDAIMNDYQLMANTLQGNSNAPSNPIVQSEYGLQNTRFDLHYDSPVEKEAVADPRMHMRLDINALDMHNDLFNSSLEAHFANVPDSAADNAISLALHYKGDTTERYAQMERKILASALTDYVKKLDAAAHKDEYEKILSTFGADNILAKIYPDIHSLGKVSVDFIGDAKGPIKDPLFVRKATFKVDELNMLAEPYGVKLKGEIEPSYNRVPAGEIDFTCIACDALLTDLGAYAMRVEALGDQIEAAARPNEMPRAAYLNKDVIEAARRLVHGLARDGNARDLAIDFVMKNGTPTISGKQLTEVLGLYMSTVAPYLGAHASSGANGGTQPEPAPVMPR